MTCQKAYLYHSQTIQAPLKWILPHGHTPLGFFTKGTKETNNYRQHSQRLSHTGIYINKISPWEIPREMVQVLLPQMREGAVCIRACSLPDTVHTTHQSKQGTVYCGICVLDKAWLPLPL